MKFIFSLLVCMSMTACATSRSGVARNSQDLAARAPAATNQESRESCPGIATAFIRSTLRGLSVRADRVIAFGEPGPQLRNATQSIPDSGLDVVGFIVGDSKTAVLSNAGMIEDSSGADAIGTAATRRTSSGSCEIVKYYIQRL
jgi:hypothetical protein